MLRRLSVRARAAGQPVHRGSEEEQPEALKLHGVALLLRVVVGGGASGSADDWCASLDGALAPLPQRRMLLSTTSA